MDEYREGTIFSYVPIAVVEKVVEKHGGIINEAYHGEQS